MQKLNRLRNFELDLVLKATYDPKAHSIHFDALKKNNQILNIEFVCYTIPSQIYSV